MKRRVSAMVFGSGVVMIGALVVGATQAQDGGSPGKFKPVSSVIGLMNGQGMAFKRLQQAVATPTMEERHKVIQVMAEVIAELSNVNQYNQSKADYQKMARETRDEALKLAEEAKKETGANDNVLRSSIRTLKSKCTACHDVYQ